MTTKAEADEIRKQVDQLVSPMTENHPAIQDLLAFWKEHRPKMYQGLSQAGVVTEYAILVTDRFEEEKSRLMVNESLDEGDAALMAGSHLLMEEEESEPEQE